MIGWQPVLISIWVMKGKKGVSKGTMATTGGFVLIRISEQGKPRRWGYTHIYTHTHTRIQTHTYAHTHKRIQQQSPKQRGGGLSTQNN